VGLSVNINRRSGQGKKQWTRSGVVSPHTPPCRDHGHDAELPQYLETQRRHGPHLRRRQGSTLLPPQVLRYIHIQIYLALYTCIYTRRFLPIIVDVLGLGGPDGPGNLASKVFPGLPGPPGHRKSTIHARVRGRSGSDRENLEAGWDGARRSGAGWDGAGRGRTGRGGAGRGGAVIQCLRQCR
jgi:hypothetical protein